MQRGILPGVSRRWLPGRCVPWVRNRMSYVRDAPLDGRMTSDERH